MTIPNPICEDETPISPEKIAEGSEVDIMSLYSAPMKSTRTGTTFNAHNYPTKINPAAILPFILVHTKPGDRVFDGFCGSGSTGIATVLAEKPRPYLDLDMVGENVLFGPRDCILYDIGALATHISDTIINPPDPEAFRRAALQIVGELKSRIGWMYEVEEAGKGEIRYIIWSDHIICPECGHSSSFWESAVKLEPLSILKSFRCSHCGHEVVVANAPHVTEEYRDDLLGNVQSRRMRTPAMVYGRTGKKTWKRRPNQADIELVRKVESTPLPPGIPVVPMLNREQKKWGELHRPGYHFGMTHLHHFYTRRNLIALGWAYELARKFPDELREGLMLWISSYNSSHSTLMTRVVCKKKGKDLIVTSSQPGALYVSNLPVEKNVISGLMEKIDPVYTAFKETHGHSGRVEVICHSSMNVNLPDESVDYVFTDPPFGDNIQYSEVNFIDEAWLGRFTEPKEEAIVSKFQGKSEKEYEAMMTQALTELKRVLKSGHYITLAFHSSKAKTWESLRRSISASGLEIVGMSLLDKSQASFKQTTTQKFVKGDALILMRKSNDHMEASPNGAIGTPVDPWAITDKRLSEIKCGDSKSRTEQGLYNYLIRYCLKNGHSVPLDASKFYDELQKRYRRSIEGFYTKKG